MGVDDQREFIDFYGIYTYDWTTSWGTYSDIHELLVTNYISDGCSTADSSEASVIHAFLFQHYIKKTYYVEGVIEGNICVAASGCTSSVTSFRVTVSTMNENTSESEIGSTGWVTVNDTLAWDAGLSVGDEIVYHFWIEVWEEHVITDKEKIFVKIEVNCNSCTHLMHSNDETWKDVWVKIPFRM